MPTLNDRFVTKLVAPAAGNKVYWDDSLKGFGVRITSAGSKAFVLNYRTGSRQQRRFTIGLFPTYSSNAARKIAKKLSLEIGQGGDPLADKEGERDAPDFKDLADYYIERHLPKKRASSAGTDKETINKVLLPKLGQRKVAAITFDQIDALHHSMRATPYRANRVVALLSKMFSLAIKKGWRTDNPCKGIERNQEMKRARYLDGGELNRLTDALAAHPDQHTANAVRLLLLTGARRGEVLSMQWDQINFETGHWTKPGATTKQKTEHVVPLNAPALALLSAMRKVSHSGFVFPGRDGTGHRVDLKKVWAVICASAEITGLRLHDLRHSYASFLVSAGLSLPVIGALLGHTQPSTTARYAHLHDDPMRKATERVGAIVEGAGKAGAKVVKIHR